MVLQNITFRPHDCVWMSRVISIKGLNVVSGGQSSLSSLSRAWMSESSLSRAWTLSLGVRVITPKSLNVVSGCQESSLSRAWTWCLDVRVITAKSLNVVSRGQSSLFNQKIFFYKKKFSGLMIVSGCQGHHCQGPERCLWMSGSSLPRAWTLCLEGLDVRVITVQEPERCDWMSGSSLSRAWMLESSLSRAWMSRHHCQGPGCQSHHCQGPERCLWMSGSSLSRAWMSRVITVKGLNVVSGCQSHHCQGPEHVVSGGQSSLFNQKNFFYKKNFFRPHDCVWMSESSLSRAWTWCLDVRVITAKSPKRCVWRSVKFV